jgi:excisionase family DNA binding protein
MMRLVERGLDDARIAERYGVTRNAVRMARKRYGIPGAHEIGWSGKAFARAMGIDRYVVYRLVREGAIDAVRTPRGEVRIKRQDAVEFLERRDWWWAWRPEEVRDPWLRQHAQRLRPHRDYYTTEEVADRLCVQVTTVRKWAVEGTIPAVRAWGRGSRWFIPVEAVENFRRPWEARSEVARRAIDRLRATGLSYAAIAVRLGFSRNTGGHVRKIHHGQVYPGPDLTAALEALVVLLPYYPPVRPALPAPRP